MRASDTAGARDAASRLDIEWWHGAVLAQLDSVRTLGHATEHPGIDAVCVRADRRLDVDELIEAAHGRGLRVVVDDRTPRRRSMRNALRRWFDRGADAVRVDLGDMAALADVCEVLGDHDGRITIGAVGLEAWQAYGRQSAQRHLPVTAVPAAHAAEIRATVEATAAALPDTVWTLERPADGEQADLAALLLLSLRGAALLAPGNHSVHGELTALRRRLPTLRHGTLRFCEPGVRQSLVYIRESPGEHVAIALNLGGRLRELRSPGTGVVAFSTHLDRVGTRIGDLIPLRAHEGCAILLDEPVRWARPGPRL